MKRFRWPVPSDQYFRRQISEHETSTVEYRIDRYSFIWSEFGPPADMLLMGGIPSLFAITELKRSYIYGNFMATVLLSQVFIEQSLGSMYAISGHDDIIGKGFAALIDMACQDGKITYELAESFHKLRRVRNPYIHHVTGLGERSYMGRIMKSDGLDPEDLVIKDAQLAVRTVADYLRQGSPDWNPGNISWNEGDD